MSPFPSKKKPAPGGLESPNPIDALKPKPQASPMDDEAGESPEDEAKEDCGAQIDAVFEGAGIDKAQGRQIAAKLFTVMADYLGGDGEDSGLDVGGGDDGVTGEPMGGGYGR